MPMNMMKRLKECDLFLFDGDGTLYLGDRPFDFTRELLQTIHSHGKRYMFMTNNSSKSVKDYVKKYERMGIPAREEDFITSSQATAHYLHAHHEGLTLYVCGTTSFKEELRQAGFTVSEQPGEAQCIVLGFDTELTFQKLHDVSFLLCTKDLPYVASHPDYVCPTEFGSVPDCGSVIDMLFAATGKRPYIVGKPEPLMPQLAMQRVLCSPERTAVIGDRIYTDVKCGLNAECLSVLVMSGETDEQALHASPDRPDVVLSDAGEILSLFPH